MTSREKAKGNAYERELCDQAKAAGLSSRRAWGSDGRALGLPQEVDCIIGTWTVQAKRRRSLPKWLAMPDGVDCVATRPDHGETIVLIRWRDFLELLEEHTG